MNTIRVLKSQEEKKATIPLYRRAFQDTEAFLSYYYNVRCRDNLILVKEKDNRIISMAHLNPYTMMVDGRPFLVYYIVAVATEPVERRQGHMREVLEYAFRLMQKERIAFCYLMPAKVSLYEGLGFEIICEFDTNPNRQMRQIQTEYAVYCQRNEAYLQYRKAEWELVCKSGDKAEDSGLPQPAVIMAKVIDKEEFSRMSGLHEETSEKHMLEWLRGKSIYICEEV